MVDGGLAVLGTTALESFLKQLGTDKVLHSKRSLYQHLCGVHAILIAWNQSEDICKAGMFHSIYSTEKFRHASLSIDERPRLQAVIGEKSERLVHLFAIVTRDAIFKESTSGVPFSPYTYTNLPCNRDGTLVIPASRAEIAQLMLLHMANRLEQASNPTGIGTWLSWVSRHANTLLSAGHALPSALRPLGYITSSDERRLRALYLGGVERLESDPRAALVHLKNACSDFGFIGEPYLMLAVAHRLLGDVKQAQEAVQRGQLLLKQWGSPWDKRLSMDGWYGLADLIRRENSLGTIMQMVRELTPEINASMKAKAVSENGVARFLSYLKSVEEDRSKRTVNWYPGLARRVWYDPLQFPVVHDLESRFAEIKAEALSIRSMFYYEEAENISRSGSWQVCMIYEQGRRNEVVCKQCPATMAVLDSNSSVRRGAGLIYISQVGPHTHVAKHKASNNIRLRCHLALSIPAGDCAIRVGDAVHRWEEGKCIVFDDTFEHEIWNRTDEERFVLIVDLWHPNLTDFERCAMDTINWLGEYKAKTMLRAWTRNDAQRRREGKFQPEPHVGAID